MAAEQPGDGRMSDGRTIRTERDMAQATWSAVLQIRKRYNKALKRIGCEPVSFADRSPFEQEDLDRRPDL